MTLKDSKCPLDQETQERLRSLERKVENISHNLLRHIQPPAAERQPWLLQDVIQILKDRGGYAQVENPAEAVEGIIIAHESQVERYQEVAKALVEAGYPVIAGHTAAKRIVEMSESQALLDQRWRTALKELSQIQDALVDTGVRAPISITGESLVQNIRTLGQERRAAVNKQEEMASTLTQSLPPVIQEALAEAGVQVQYVNAEGIAGALRRLGEVKVQRDAANSLRREAERDAERLARQLDAAREALRG